MHSGDLFLAAEIHSAVRSGRRGMNATVQ